MCLLVQHPAPRLGVLCPSMKITASFSSFSQYLLTVTTVCCWALRCILNFCKVSLFMGLFRVAGGSQPIKCPQPSWAGLNSAFRASFLTSRASSGQAAAKQLQTQKLWGLMSVLMHSRNAAAASCSLTFLLLQVKIQMFCLGIWRGVRCWGATCLVFPMSCVGGIRVRMNRESSVGHPPPHQAALQPLSSPSCLVGVRVRNRGWKYRWRALVFLPTLQELTAHIHRQTQMGDSSRADGDCK